MFIGVFVYMFVYDELTARLPLKVTNEDWKCQHQSKKIWSVLRQTFGHFVEWMNGLMNDNN